MSNTLRLKPNRRQASIPAVQDDLRNHTQVLMAVKQAVEVGKRDTTDVLNSFVRVQDLVDIGLITYTGDINSLVGADLSQIANIGDLTSAATGDFLRFDGANWVNDQLTLSDITSMMVTQHQAALSIGWGQVTGAPSFVEPGDLGAVAFSNDYGDLDNLPTIPTDLVDLGDVNITSPGSGQDGYAVIWDNASSRFILAAVSSSGGQVDAVTGTTDQIEVDSTDPTDPVLSLATAVLSSLSLADTAIQAGDLATVAISGAYGDLSGAPTIPTAADPSATIGLTAVNGSASTFMRSDAAPALSQAITPTWTGSHNFGANARITSVATTAFSADGDAAINLSSTSPAIRTYVTNGAVNARRFEWLGFSTSYRLWVYTDTYASQKNLLLFNMSSGAVDSIEYGNSTDLPGHIFYGDVQQRGPQPTYRWIETDAAANNGLWWEDVAGGVRRFFAVSDNFATFAQWLAVTRSGAAISAMEYGNSTDSPAHTFAGIHNNSGGNLRSGTYTPTGFTGTSVSAVTPHVCQWMRVGNVVTVSGQVNVTVSSSGSQEFQMSLPIASALATETQLSGAGCPNASSFAWAVRGSVANDRAQFTSFNNTTGAIHFTFTYLVV